MAFSYHSLKGVTSYHRDNVTQNLRHSIIAFFQWGLANVGNFQNITRSPAISGVYGGDKFRLRPVSDPRFTDGKVWEGYRGDWVWETGLSWATTPIRPTGLWINDSFSTLNELGAYVDYKRGRVVLATGIATSSVVETEFSPRRCSILDAEDKWPRKLMLEPDRIDYDDFLTMGSGQWSELADVRAQLPLVAVEIVPSLGQSFKPYQITQGQWVYQDILYHIFTDNEPERDQLKDIISLQNDHVVRLIDRGSLKDDSIYPVDLDYNGALVDSPIQYPELVATTGYYWNKAWLINTRSVSGPTVNSWLYTAVVRQTAEMIMENI